MCVMNMYFHPVLSPLFGRRKKMKLLKCFGSCVLVFLIFLLLWHRLYEYLHEVFPTKVKQCLNWWFLRGAEQFDGKAVVILLFFAIFAHFRADLSTQDLSAK